MGDPISREDMLFQHRLVHALEGPGVWAGEPMEGGEKLTGPL